MRTELLDSLAAIRCFGDQSHIGLSTEEYCYALPDEDVVVEIGILSQLISLNQIDAKVGVGPSSR